MAINKPNFIVNTVTIANGATTSDALDFQGRGLVMLVMPAAFTGTTITFQVSVDGSTYQAAYNTANTALSITVAVSRTYLFTPSDMVGIRYLKLVSGSSEGGSRSIILASRDLL